MTLPSTRPIVKSVSKYFHKSDFAQLIALDQDFPIASDLVCKDTYTRPVLNTGLGDLRLPEFTLVCHEHKGRMSGISES